MIITNKNENTIEKFTGKLEKEDPGFTLFHNDTIQNITNAGALGIYCYLTTKPKNWPINVKEISSHFNIGKDKTRNLLNYLININALSVKTVREKGRFAGGITELNNLEL